ncbi:hypothetical protein EDC32_10325 [Laceyella sacchari]|jgi:hypothetical protein|nr:hypothetical protein EDC32_10325 [Laceyella sacchari]
MEVYKLVYVSSCRRKKRKRPLLCRRCRWFLLHYGALPFETRRRRRRRRKLSRPATSTSSNVNNSANIGAVSGLINIIVQVPVNTGDATTLNNSDQNSTTNAL